MVRGIMAGLLFFNALGCLSEPSASLDQVEEGRYAERWRGGNAPSLFPERMVYDWNELSQDQYRTGVVESRPWPDTYWPMRKDGYNYRWQGQSRMSPVELYDTAFNGWRPPAAFMSLKPFTNPRTSFDRRYYELLGPAATWAHREGGNYRVMNGVDDDGNGSIDDRWDGLEEWTGHCHAWAQAAYYYPEPRRSVTVNNVTFEVADIKALVAATFEEADYYFLGGRCDRKTVRRNKHGRIIASECRDTNPGSFHVVMVNMVNRHRQSFVIDASYGYQVWNFPVYGYTIQRQQEVTKSKASQLLGFQGAYPYNEDAERFVWVEMEVEYVGASHASARPFGPDHEYVRRSTYKYLLEIDESDAIIGGEWIEADPHPDFLWATEAPAHVHRQLNNGRLVRVINRANVQQLLEESLECGACDGRFRVGAMVKAVVNNPGRSRGLPAGSLGMVLASSTEGRPLLVQWTEWENGHDGRCERVDCGRCLSSGSSRWYVNCDEVTLWVDVLPLSE
jgi:hypothetical protein